MLAGRTPRGAAGNKNKNNWEVVIMRIDMLALIVLLLFIISVPMYA